MKLLHPLLPTPLPLAKAAATLQQPQSPAHTATTGRGSGKLLESLCEESDAFQCSQPWVLSGAGLEWMWGKA